jgi:hypothetical protein
VAVWERHFAGTCGGSAIWGSIRGDKDRFR